VKSIDWSLKVANPEAFGEAEKEQWVRVQPILTEVLDELWEADKIETVYEPAEKRAFLSCIQKVDDFGAVHNALLHLSDSREKASSFQDATSRFGFDEPKITANYILVAFSLAVLKIELFKLVLLFHMKDVDEPNVSNFGVTMRNAAPSSWPKLRPLVDSPLRNALAHGTYMFAGKKIVLFQDAKLKPMREMDLAGFIMRAKAQDVLLQCLVNLLREKGFYALDL